MDYSILTNTQSPEMCMFFNMIFESRKKSEHINKLKQTFDATIRYNELKTYRDKMKKLQLQKHNVSKQIDMLSGPAGMSGTQYAQWKKWVEIYNTINQSILKQQLKYL